MGATLESVVKRMSSGCHGRDLDYMRPATTISCINFGEIQPHTILVAQTAHQVYMLFDAFQFTQITRNRITYTMQLDNRSIARMRSAIWSRTMYSIQSESLGAVMRR